MKTSNRTIVTLVLDSNHKLPYCIWTAGRESTTHCGEFSSTRQGHVDTQRLIGNKQNFEVRNFYLSTDKIPPGLSINEHLPPTKKNRDNTALVSPLKLCSSVSSKTYIYAFDNDNECPQISKGFQFFNTDIFTEAFKLLQFIKNGVFWDVRPSGSSKNRRFGGT
jgi:hypothetical protein